MSQSRLHILGCRLTATVRAGNRSYVSRLINVGGRRGCSLVFNKTVDQVPDPGQQNNLKQADTTATTHAATGHTEAPEKHASQHPPCDTAQHPSGHIPHKATARLLLRNGTRS